MTDVSPMVWPLLSMAALTCLVWLRLYQVRLAEMSRRRIDPQALASAADVGRLLADVRASDNFRNLFELPVLFYAAVLLAIQLGVDDSASLILAWCFVAGRVAHSVVHCTYNRVMHRFATYALSTLCLWALCGRLAYLICT
ncbi:MAPEG family protein [Xanthomonadaceae bacterium JHOS43]|nr:MAPEG family protein [Xanthomonadaceae bacterium JHOS43]MCX7563385.1 MAPEG family protein [Xanthomonadaceae bacterium XH05]